MRVVGFRVRGNGQKVRKTAVAFRDKGKGVAVVIKREWVGCLWRKEKLKLFRKDLGPVTGRILPGLPLQLMNEPTVCIDPS